MQFLICRIAVQFFVGRKNFKMLRVAVCTDCIGAVVQGLVTKFPLHWKFF